MIDAASTVGHGKHVDQCARRVRNIDPCGASPYRLHTKESPLVDVMYEKIYALCPYTFLIDAARREYSGLIEELLGKVPMVCCGPTSHVAFPEERRNQYPRVVNDLLSAGETERHGDIRSGANSSEPALLRPPR